MAEGRTLDGIALGSIAAGAILTYAGIRGKSVPSLLTGFIQGKAPSKASASNPIAGTGSSGQTVEAPGTGASAGAGENLVMAAILARIGAPPTRANLASLVNWSALECPWNSQPPDGALYTNNPMNTTLQTGGSVGTVNSVGVQIYRNIGDGISATAQTLLGGYPAIVSALRAGTGLQNAGGQVAAELSKWSGGGYSSV